MLERLDPKKADKLFWLFFVLGTVVQFWVLQNTQLSLSADEAHYWEWSRHPDYAYYSKGPLVAYLIKWSVGLFGNTELGVRFPAFILSSLFSLIFYFFVRKHYGAPLAFVGWAALRTMPIFSSQSFIMTTDSPAALLWLIAIVFSYEAITKNSTRNWAIALFAIGLGILAKYTLAILFASIVLFLVLTPSLRSHLKSAGFLVGTGLLGLCLIPILYWNSQNAWVNFLHNANHVVKTKKLSIIPHYLVELIGGQLGLAGPVFFVATVYALLLGFRAWRKGDEKAGLFFFSSILLVALCIVVSLHKRVYANWPMPVYIGGILLVVHLGKEKFKRWFLPGIAISFFITVLAHELFLGFTFGLPGKILPTKKLVGWEQLADRVESVNGGNTLPVITDNYGVSSSLSFYLEGKPFVYCANTDDRRMNQYDIWGGWQKLKGQDALIVLKKSNVSDEFATKFKKIEEISSLKISYGNSSTIREFYLFLGYGFDGSDAGLSSHY